MTTDAGMACAHETKSRLIQSEGRHNGSNSESTSLLTNALLWFGAGVSLAEILTGTYLAGMELSSAVLAIVLGHIIGGVLLFFSGLIGAREKLAAMDTVKGSFGSIGGRLFAVLNVVQLVGWTGIMLYDGALATEGIYPLGGATYAVILGLLLLFWLHRGLAHASRVNVFAVAGLFLLTLVLSYVLASGGSSMGVIEASSAEVMTFGAALELSIVMPLSWLPLISDYTSKAASPIRATAVSAVSYTVVSIWMYGIGMTAAKYFGESDISAILLKAGLGTAALFIVLFSTVTTAFLDAYSAGVSARSISSRIDETKAAVSVVILGTLGAMFLPMDDITEFLYFIGSVFAPMIAILLTDYFLLGHKETVGAFHIKNLRLWLVGFILYRYVMSIELSYGYTIPTMLAVAALKYGWEKISPARA
ncbi:putative hydroxymethylpyrimidine transporter CytX [Selenomonas sp. TAMA-11512]|uniref:putative hydroxymethylpyrimidine transporter CytX n=1 Tax=Selenomonas sp. TAMA-11512 TaxID=3095337 RepID=UPI00308FF5E3|nr:putative hydroxymethylpyrimidine transporter CytX [Selenomonas sp. TAMA-11512]